MNPSFSERLGEKIRYFRSSARQSQSNLASTAGLTNGYLSDVENGKVNISISNLHNIANALNIPLKDLFTEEEANREELIKHLNEQVLTIPASAIEGILQILQSITKQEISSKE